MIFYHKIIKIETYWNVNMEEAVEEVQTETIKIETYWNVNTEAVIR